MSTVLLYNHGGCENRGCEAIVRATSELLRDEAGARVRLTSATPAYDSARGLDAIERIAADQISPYSVSRLINSVGFRLGMSRESEVARKWSPVIRQGRCSDVCLSVGGDKAYLVSDRACGGSDTLATGYILSKAKEKIEELEGIKFDMLMFGKQAIDGDTAQVGPQVAEDLDIPQVTYGWEVWPTEDGKGVRVKKELEDGFEILEMACPCAVTITKPDYEPRFPTIKSKMAANKAKIPVLNAADCGLDVERSGLKGSPTKVKKSFTPPRKEGGLKIKEETPEESAKKLYDLLKDKGVI